MGYGAVQKEGRSVAQAPQVACIALLRPYLWRYGIHKMLFLDSLMIFVRQR
jgi:hypothetical protein